MEDITLKIFLIFLIGCVRYTKTENNEDVSEEYEIENNSSLNSESNEAFNVGSKENRINSQDISDIDNGTLHTIEVSTVQSTPKSVNYKLNRTSKAVSKTIRRKSHVNYPFAVSIQKKSSHYASGALVDEKWILTSATEFYNVRESIKLFKARLGSVNCKKGGFLFALQWIEIHPAYVYKNPAFDVALLKLAAPVGYSEHVTPIAISATRGRVVSAKFLSTYWPRLIINNEILPQSAKERYKQNSMRISTQNLIPRNKCDKAIKKHNTTLDRSTLCLEPIVSHHTVCVPDPGAPVVAKDGLWGITSGWTPERCTINTPILFTRLSSPRVHSWLQTLLVDNN